MIISELPGDDEAGTCRTFVLAGVSLTLGRALKLVIDQYEDVECCNYRTPHPGTPTLHFRIQARETTAMEILKRGLADISTVCRGLIDEKIKNICDSHVSDM